MLKYIPNYWLNSLEPGSIKDSDFDKFDSDMREVLKYIKYSKDYDALENMLTNDKAYSRLKRKTAELINIVTNSNMKFKEEGAVVDRAIREKLYHEFQLK